MKSDIIDLVTRLSQVTKFSITASDAKSWSTRGDGIVSVEKKAANILIWRESGRWDQSMNGLEFSNIYRWTKMRNQELQLEHLRYGAERPVKLVNLQPSKHHQWISRTPHYCVHDSYELNLDIEPARLILQWKIKGPNKDQLSTIYYH